MDDFAPIQPLYGFDSGFDQHDQAAEFGFVPPGAVIFANQQGLSRPPDLSDDAWMAVLEGEGYVRPGGGLNFGGGGAGFDAAMFRDIAAGAGDLLGGILGVVQTGILAKQGQSNSTIAALQQQLAGVQQQYGSGQISQADAQAQLLAMQQQYAAQIAALQAQNKGSFLTHPATIVVGSLLTLGLFGVLVTLMSRRRGGGYLPQSGFRALMASPAEVAAFETGLDDYALGQGMRADRGFASEDW